MERTQGLNTTFRDSMQEIETAYTPRPEDERRKGERKSSSNVGGVEFLMMLVLSLLAFLIPWIFTPFTYEFYEITKNTILIIGVILLLTLWAVKATVKKQLTLVKTPFDLPILVFLISQIVSTIFAIYKQTSIWGYYSRFTGGLISTITLILLYYIVVNNVNKRKYINQLIRSSTISIVLLALFVILKAFNVFEPFFEKLATSHPSLSFLSSEVFTPIGTPNALPFLFVLILPVILSFLTDAQEKAMQQIGAITGACICLFAIGITSAVSTLDLYSIAVWLLVLGVLVGLVISKLPVSNNVLLQFLPVALIAIFSMLFAFRPQIREMLSTNLNFARYPEVPFNTTWSVITGTFRVHKVGGFLVGTGPDTYAYDFPRFRPIEQNLEPNWHQNYTRSSTQIYGLLVESGILGLVSFAFLMFVSVAFVIRKGLKREVGSEKEVMFGLGVSILVILVSGFIVFFPVTIIFYLWLLLGLAVASYHLVNKRAKEDFTFSLIVSKSKVAVENEKEIIPSIFLAISTIFLLVCTFFVVRNFYTEVQYKKSLVASYWRDYESSNDHIVGAIKKNDKRDYYHRQLAYVALQALKETVSDVSSEEEVDQSYQNYLVSLIREEINKAKNLNQLDPANWEAAAVIFKQLVELSGGRLYGDETLYAAAQSIFLNPYNPDNYIILGYIRQFNASEELRQKAEQVFVQAYNLQPSYALSIFALGNYLEFVQKYDEALNLYQHSITQYYSSESQINILLNERISTVLDKKAGATEEEQLEPTDEDITEEVEENVMPSPLEGDSSTDSTGSSQEGSE